MENQQVTLNTPSNLEIARAFSVSEGTIRNKKKNDMNEYLDLLKQYRLEKTPFVPLDDYNSFYNKNYTVDDIVSQKIPGLLTKSNDGLIPAIYDKIKDGINLVKQQNGCTVISFANFKGGVGKTTSTVNIATSLAYHGAKVLIVDFDTQGNTTSLFNINRKKRSREVDLKENRLEVLYDLENADYKYTIIDLLVDVENKNIKNMVKEGVVNLNDKAGIPTIGRLDILPNSSDYENINKSEQIENYLNVYGNINRALDDILSHIKDDYDFILIDTPPTIKLELRMSVMASDYFIIILTPDKMAKDGIEPFLAPIERHRDVYKREKGKDICILNAILNKFQVNSVVQNANKEIIDEDLFVTTTNSSLGNSKLYNTIIRLDNMLIEAQFETGSALFYKPMHNLVRNYFDLTDEILDDILSHTISIQSQKEQR